MKVTFANKILLFVSYSFVPLGLLCLWAGIHWHKNAQGFQFISYILFILAVALPVIGLHNAKRVKAEQNKGKNRIISENDHNT